MTPPHPPVGEVLRRLRTERQLSLAVVAQKAGISVATLSRVETEKQNIDVALMVRLATVLGVPPAELVDGGNGDGHRDPQSLSRHLSRLSTFERAKLFLESSRRRNQQELSTQIDDLVATVDLLREELVQLQRSIRRRKR